VAAGVAGHEELSIGAEHQVGAVGGERQEDSRRDRAEPLPAARGVDQAQLLVVTIGDVEVAVRRGRHRREVAEPGRARGLAKQDQPEREDRRQRDHQRPAEGGVNHALQV